MHKLSVLIHSYNNEKIIRRCLESVKWADEIVICDSFSSDKTVNICRGYTDKIYYYEHKNSADQKNWAIPKCAHTWIFQIDTDEVISSKLVMEIKELFSQGKILCNAFKISRENHLFGRQMRGAGLYPDRIVRLFRNYLRYEDKPIHARLIVNEKIGELQGSILHYGFEDWKTLRWKFSRYRILEYLDFKKGERTITIFHPMIFPIGIFVYLFFLKGGFIDGWRGFIWASFISMVRLFVYMDMILGRKIIGGQEDPGKQNG